MADNRPIIIKKVKKVSGGGHHGGAWKVAYADFVTAMMAFFLLMWLLNATSADVKKGLADYFDQRIPISMISGGGESAFSGDSVTAKQKLAESGEEPASKPVGGAAGEADAKAQETASGAAEGAGAGAEARAFEMIEAAFQSLSGESDIANEMLRHVRTRVTPDGLVIDIFDTDGKPLFERGSAQPTPMLRALVEVVASVALLVTNDIALTGHTDAVGAADVNWTLSSERAQTARRLMTGAGLDEGRVAQVSGRAATRPMVDDPADPRNRRVEITLLRSPAGR